MDNELSAAFDQLKPFCVAVASSPDVIALKQLTQALERLSDTTVYALQDYILFPLRLFLRHSEVLPDEAMLCASLDCICLVLQKAKTLKRSASCLDLLSQLAALLDSPCASRRFLQLSSSYQLAVLRCIAALLSCIDVTLLFSRDARQPDDEVLSNNAIVGHAIFVLLEILSSNKYLRVSLIAASCLKSLFAIPARSNTTADDDSLDVVVRNVASILPGATTRLSALMTSSALINHDLCGILLSAFTNLISFVMSDAVSGRSGNACLNNYSTMQTASSNGVCQAERPEDNAASTVVGWFQEARDKLRPIVAKTFGVLVRHSHWQVRKDLIAATSQLMVNCHETLASLDNTLLETLLLLSEDEFVAVNALQAIAELRPRCKCSDSTVDTYVASFAACVTRLPQVVRSASDELAKASLRLFVAYLQWFNCADVLQLCRSPQRLNQLVQVLIQLVELDVQMSPIAAIELSRASLMGSEAVFYFHLPRSSETLQQSRYSLKYASETNAKLCWRAIATLGAGASFEPFVSALLDVVLQGSNGRITTSLEVAYLLNVVFVAKCNELRQKTPLVTDGDLPLHLVYSVGDACVLALEALLLELRDDTACDREHPQLQAASNRQRRSVCVRLLVELLGRCALLLSVDGEWLKNASAFLNRTLYAVLPFFTFDDHCIKEAVCGCLVDYVLARQADTVEQLLSASCGCFCFMLDMQLRQLSLNHQAPLVLIALIRLGSVNVLCRMKKIVSDILDVFDSHYMEECALLLKVFQAVVHLMADQRFAECSNMAGDRQRAIRCGDSVAVDDADAGEQPFASDDISVNGSIISRSLNVDIVLRIIRRVKHLLSVASSPVQLAASDILLHCILVLHSHCEELLPVIHEIWPSVAVRFSEMSQDRNHVSHRPKLSTAVSIKVFDIICAVCSFSKSFVYHRIKQDILPSLIGFLQMQSESVRRGSSQQSALHRLLSCLLRNTGTVCYDIGIAMDDLRAVLAAVLPYCCLKPPTELAAAATDCVLDLFACFSAAKLTDVAETDDCSEAMLSISARTRQLTVEYVQTIRQVYLRICGASLSEANFCQCLDNLQSRLLLRI